MCVLLSSLKKNTDNVSLKTPSANPIRCAYKVSDDTVACSGFG